MLINHVMNIIFHFIEKLYYINLIFQ